ncbi:LCP family protein [Clostridium sp. MSJ-4]|uniref:LCP family protein n=1 Tax=Clostridium simiarum TaxID=2841506 RepID=A0ABS6F2E4_9CLOT|nr:LCP family protein [Clostridium simiarum]MBU5592555.1 LCP family protein [Clostridium simiarum]
MRKKKKRGFLGRLICFILIVALFSSAFFTYFGYLQFKKVKNVKLPKSDEELKIDSDRNNIAGEDLGKRHNVKNILLLGVDKQEDASDSIIVFSLDSTSNTVKMSSLMRDSYIEFGKDKINKLNYAYHYGGPELAVKTVNENYKLDIRDYIKVDFGSLDKIVDAFGGVDIEVKKEELKLLNDYVWEIASIEKTEPKYLKAAGVQRLNGQQAVAYCRIRYVGKNDEERTERQRRVLKSLFSRVKDISPTSYPQLLSDISSYIETSLDYNELLFMAPKIVLYGSKDIKETRVPYDGLKSDATIKGIYYLKWDVEKNLQKFHKFLYFE